MSDHADPTELAPHDAQRVELERGRLLNDTGDPTGAALHFERARDLDGSPALTVEALVMLGVVDPSHSQHHLDEGLALIRASDDPDVTRWEGPLYNNHAWNCHDAGDDAEALGWFIRAERWYLRHGTPEQHERAQEYVVDCRERLQDQH